MNGSRGASLRGRALLAALCCALPIALGGAVLHSAGCATQQLDARMAPWVGRNVSDLIAEWGAPQQSLPDGAGGQILTWFEQRFTATPQLVYVPPGACYQGNWGPGWYSGGPYGWSGPFVHDKYVVSRSFWVDAQGTVTRYAWKGM